MHAHSYTHTHDELSLSLSLSSAIVAQADLSLKNVEDILQRHCQSKRMRGIRHMLNFHPTKSQYSETKHDSYLTDPQWLCGIALLEKYGLSFEIHVLPHQMKRSADVVQQFPNVQFMVDHCGLPYERDEDTMQLWREGRYDCQTMTFLDNIWL